MLTIRHLEKGSIMITKTLTALAVAGTLAVAAVAAPQPAEARGGRIAAGIIGGLAAGAIIGGIASNGYGYYVGMFDSWHMIWDLAGESTADQSVFIQMNYSFVAASTITSC